MDRAIRESLREGDDLRAGILMRRAGQVEDALDLFEALWSARDPIHYTAAGELLLDAVLCQPEWERIQYASRLDRLAWLGLEGAESLWSAWFPAATCLVGWSEPMRKLRAFLYEHATTRDPLILWGESGVGHSLAARTLHTLSEGESYHQAYAPASLGRLTAEITSQPRPGGTLYLSYATETESWEDAVLEICEARDIRLIVGLVGSGEPRGTLRGRVVPTCSIAPLRERFCDLPLLLEELLGRVGVPAPGDAITSRVVNILQWHDWPGNVRELANHVSRAVLQSSKEVEGIPELLIQGMFGLPGEVSQQQLA